MNRLIYLTFALFLFAPAAQAATLGEDGALAGSVEALGPDGKKIIFPLLKSDIDAEVAGDLATVKVTQTFTNPSDVPLNATYLFPLNHEAAVYKMVMEVGDEVVEARIKKKEEAKQVFEQAKSEGKAAALLTQYRPNMFTQNIANLMPGMPVKVTMSYTQSVPKLDGAYELVMPLIVGPRYQPEGVGEKPELAAEEVQKVGNWELEELPEYPDVAGLTVPDEIEPGRVGIKVHLRAGMPITEVTSATHALDIASPSKKESTVTLAEGRTIDNRDFVLRYRLAGAATQPGMLAHQDARGGFFSLMIEPPAMPAPKDIAPREFVFVLDTSGSMTGEPLDASKLFMQRALAHLRPTDYFRILHFGSNAEEFLSAPVAATPANLRAGEEYVNKLFANGGTEMDRALTQAFSVAQQPDTLRLVVFLTDGYIGNESTILSHLKEEIGQARVYALGVGTSVNRYLLEEMARAGRGQARFIDPTEQPEETAIALAAKLETPVLTDISIDWGKLNPTDIAPVSIPDLFAGDNIRIQGRYAKPGNYTIRVNGKIGARKASLPLNVTLPENSDERTESIPLVWARSQVSEKMRLIDAPYTMKGGEKDEDLQEEVTQLGLDYALATRWTSFVAVSKKVVNAHPETSQDGKIPLPMVKGVTPAAYGDSGSLSGQINAAMASMQFASAAAPEPATIGGLALLTLAGGLTMRRRKKV